MVILENLRNELRDQVNNVRAIQRVINGDEFEELFTNADKKEQLIAQSLISEGKRTALSNWIYRRQEVEIGSMSVRRLRNFAQRLGVRNYNRLPKASLLSEITHATRRTKEKVQEAANRA